MIIGNNPCELHIDFQGDFCPVCLENERTFLKTSLRDVLNILEKADISKVSAPLLWANVISEARVKIDKDLQSVTPVQTDD